MFYRRILRPILRRIAEFFVTFEPEEILKSMCGPAQEFRGTVTDIVPVFGTRRVAISLLNHGTHSVDLTAEQADGLFVDKLVFVKAFVTPDGDVVISKIFKNPAALEHLS